MRRVRCYDCGKRYDYDVDDFCPRCGAFTLPSRGARIGADGTVVRADGINEQYHRNSFVHAELHEENRERKGTRLEQKKPLKRVTVRKAGTFQIGQQLPQRPAKVNVAGDLLEGLSALADLFDA